MCKKQKKNHTVSEKQKCHQSNPVVIPLVNDVIANVISGHYLKIL